MSGVFDELASELESPPTPPAHPPRRAPAEVLRKPPPLRFKLLTTAELHALPRLRWLVHGVLPQTGLAAIYGVSGAAKSSLYHLDLVASLCEGGEWFGYRLAGGLRIVLVILEGEAGFRTRVEAWEKDRGRAFPETVRFVFQGFDLRTRASHEI